MNKINIITIAATVAISFSVGTIAAPGGMPETKPGGEADVVALEGVALDLAQNNGCFTCHAVEKKIIGPAWMDVAAKYRDDAKAEEWLVSKVSKGGSGVWGKDMVMPPFAPHMEETDIRTLVEYILSLR